MSIQYVTIEIKDGTIISVSKPIDTVVTIKDYDCLEEVEKQIDLVHAIKKDENNKYYHEMIF